MADAPKVKLPAVPNTKPKAPKLFGYRPPKWAHNFEFVRTNKGKGSSDDSKTWLIYTIDRLLKMHSV